MRKYGQRSQARAIFVALIIDLVIAPGWLEAVKPVFAADAARSTQARWEDVVKGAEKEGEVTVYATNSVGDLQVIWDAFRKKFPKITLNSVGISTTSEIVTKTMAERRGGPFFVASM